MMIDTKSYRQFSKLKLFLEITPYKFKTFTFEMSSFGQH